MRMIALAFSTAAALLAVFLPTSAEAQRVCRIADPTGTPANVRAAPQGRITGNIANGARVRIVGHQNDAKGQPWVRIGDDVRGPILGWVILRHVRC